jgi:periplasmic protein TonB
MMPAIRLLGLLLSVLLHAVFALPFLVWSGSDVLHVGESDDLLRIEQGIAIEGLIKLGEAETTTEAQNMPLAEASMAQHPVEEVKAFEPSDNSMTRAQATAHRNVPLEVVTAKDGQEQNEKVEVVKPPEEPKPEDLTPDKPGERQVIDDIPPPELEEPRPKQMMALQSIEQFAVREQQSSGEEKTGGDATLRAAYLGKLRMHLERHKVRPEAKATGTAVARFTVDPTGKILSREITSSSGSKKLDDAAIATIERSAPFPAFPVGLAHEPVVVQVPFKFRLGH